MIWRTITTLAGLAALGLGAHYVIVKSGLEGSVEAFVAYGAVGIIAVVASTAAQAAASRRYAVAFGLTLALLAAEANALVRLAERVIADRHQVQVVAKAAAHTRKEAQAHVVTLRRDMPETTPRLERALASLDAGLAAQAEATTKNGCRKNCTEDMRTQVALAQAEVEQARTDLAERQARAKASLENAERRLAELPATPSPSPLADALGLQAWVIDLTVGALMSVSINGAGIFLIVFGTKGTTPRKDMAEDRSGPEIKHVTTSCNDMTSVHDVPQCIGSRYVSERLKPASGERVRLVDVAADVERWSRVHSVETPEKGVVLSAMERAGLRGTVGEDGVAYVLDVSFVPLLIAA